MNIIDHLQGKSPWGTKRSPHWEVVRATFLGDNPECACCGGRNKLNVHHKKPFHLFPELELVPDNLITLCEGGKHVNCHLVMGHLLYFKSYNPNVEQDVSLWKTKILRRPE
jgi:5-methylcytosine-specific restriction enzyme A